MSTSDDGEREALAEALYSLFPKTKNGKPVPFSEFVAWDIGAGQLLNAADAILAAGFRRSEAPGGGAGWTKLCDGFPEPYMRVLTLNDSGAYRDAWWCSFREEWMVLGNKPLGYMPTWWMPRPIDDPVSPPPVANAGGAA